MNSEVLSKKFWEKGLPHCNECSYVSSGIWDGGHKFDAYLCGKTKVYWLKSENNGNLFRLDAYGAKFIEWFNKSGFGDPYLSNLLVNID